MAADRVKQKEACRLLYVSGKNNQKELAAAFGVSIRTIRNWIKQGGWKQEISEISGLEEKIEIESKRAYLTALTKYSENPDDPKNKELLTKLKEFRQAKTPHKVLEEQLLTFSGYLVDYLNETDSQELADGIKRELEDICIYIKRRCS